MNTNSGLIGKKLGHTQIFNEDGSVTRVTAVLVGPCTVIGKRTMEKDGYSAVMLGFGDRPEKQLTKPEAGFFKKADQKAVRTIREFRLPSEQVEKYELGQVVKPSECFVEGEKVDVSGKAKGRGFAGVIKRWGHAGTGTDGHGSHEVKRHGGSIGANMTPGRTLPNKKMAGQYGNHRVTKLNLKVARIMDDENLVLIKGAIPGSRNSVVTIRGAVKAKPSAA